MSWRPLGIALDRFIIEAAGSSLRGWAIDAADQGGGPLPVAVVVAEGPWQVKVRCPYGCRGGHFHGRGEGPREPHCADRRARQYLVLSPASIEDFTTASTLLAPTERSTP